MLIIVNDVEFNFAIPMSRRFINVYIFFPVAMAHQLCTFVSPFVMTDILPFKMQKGVAAVVENTEIFCFDWCM